MTLWSERDEPVLRWFLENPPVDGMLRIHALSDQPFDSLPGLTQPQVYLAIETLRDAGFLASDDGKWSSGGGFTITHIQVTGKGKQSLGLWPKFDALGSPGELASLLDALADDAPTEEEASNLKTSCLDRAPGRLRRWSVRSLRPG